MFLRREKKSKSAKLKLFILAFFFFIFTPFYVVSLHQHHLSLANVRIVLHVDHVSIEKGNFHLLSSFFFLIKVSIILKDIEIFFYLKAINLLLTTLICIRKETFNCKSISLSLSLSPHRIISFIVEM